jgi:hypothetical protein
VLRHHSVHGVAECTRFYGHRTQPGLVDDGSLSGNVRGRGRGASEKPLIYPSRLAKIHTTPVSLNALKILKILVALITAVALVALMAMRTRHCSRRNQIFE